MSDVSIDREYSLSRLEGTNIKVTNKWGIVVYLAIQLDTRTGTVSIKARIGGICKKKHDGECSIGGCGYCIFSYNDILYLTDTPRLTWGKKDSISLKDLLFVFRPEINKLHRCVYCETAFFSNINTKKCQECFITDFLQGGLDECSICYNMITQKDELILDCCHNKAHEKCIEKCNGKCPYCRSNTSKELPDTS
mgnify:CR=1 FL=1